MSAFCGLVFLVPFKSSAQRNWGHTPEGEKALGGPAAVAEWDKDTPSSLPKHVRTVNTSKWRKAYEKRQAKKQ